MVVLTQSAQMFRKMYVRLTFVKNVIVHTVQNVFDVMQSCNKCQPFNSMLCTLGVSNRLKKLT